MFEILYLSPYYEREVHERIVDLLEKIRARHNVRWREVVVEKPWSWSYKPVEMSEKEAYDTYLKPATRRIRACLEALAAMGVEVYVENVSRKFRARSGNYHVAGSLVLLKDGKVFCALGYKEEILRFLEKLLREGPGFLAELAARGAGGAPSLTAESSIVARYARTLRNHGYKVFLNVKNNIMTWEEPKYLFQPDADIIAVKGSTILGFEVKGTRKGAVGLDQFYVGLGEALLYLINPVLFTYKNRDLCGGVFDKVYLLLPELPATCGDDLVRLVKNVRIVGLMTLKDGTIVEPDPNPPPKPREKDPTPEQPPLVNALRLLVTQDPGHSS